MLPSSAPFMADSLPLTDNDKYTNLIHYGVKSFMKKGPISKCYITLRWKGLPGKNTIPFGAQYSQLAKKIKGRE